jgi:hypothetical protein
MSQENLNLFRPKDLAQGLSGHGPKHVTNSSLQVEANETELLVL